ncbi:restriction endonuclease subunit S [Citrobacter freundii]|uniref:restriction endonuclease subunit S n=1 Tax=Enterobacteriaceae TaxID=543 RepID=UPI000D040F25|nr:MULTISPECIES: restriction endonuclease subunit S [Enterobacteriaceae]MBQ5149546.1 restriction endonuclease subunit S [Citrobacter freundii]PRW40490.1 type I restriction modification DNA specificity domain protein [Enterobacter roggenkampii]QLR26467.1 restriction endonuclease subunit S [Citrobacter sp. RHBSTW-01013]QLU53603.1 restriction endonuclease subunit S [Citrobacter sp. RHBSTW-00696]QLV17896.1 restriction endonuclease subunit S [Enterobacter roggenkampii]
MVPKLRFEGFNKNWAVKKLDSIFSFKNGLNASKEMYGKGVKFINVLDIINNDKITYDVINESVGATDDQISSYQVMQGDILFQRSSETRDEVGQTNVYADSKTVLFGGFVIRGRPLININSTFLNYQLKTDALRKDITQRSGGSTRYNIGQDSLGKVTAFFPEIREQEKIANFLSSVDEKMALLNKQYNLLCQYKKGMMQKIFSQEVRFKDENGEGYPEWKYVDLKEIASKVNIKNREGLVNVVLTNSATQGIVRQDSYFEREIVTESNLQGYYVVSVGDFIYNPRISATAPVGPIKMNELIQGVMSPLYTVFRFKKGLLKFYQYFFESSVWHDYMKSVANSGARHDRMNISGADFFALPVSQPIEAEQSKIANFLSAIDEKISAKKAELDKLKNWKQGLLQQMFI